MFHLSNSYLGKTLIIFLTLILVLPSVHAIETFSGYQISIDSEISDDIFASGGIIEINAPVDGAVLAGGKVTINAPIYGDLFVTGGQIYLNSNVRGKIVASGGDIEMDGDAREVVFAGGNINIHSGSEIEEDAYITGGNVRNSGQVEGTLKVRANTFENQGEAGTVDFQREDFMEAVTPFFEFVSLVITFGFLLLGIIIMKLFRGYFFRVEEEARESVLKKILIGFFGIIVSGILFLLLTITIVGIPIVMFFGMVFLLFLMLSTLIVSYSVGKIIFDFLERRVDEVIVFIVGFVVLNLLFRIPIIGWIIGILAVSLGFGAIVYSIYRRRKKRGGGELI